MKTEIKKQENSTAKISIDLNKEEFGKYIEMAFKEEVQKIEVDGFRKGKMPKSMFMKKYGEASLYPTAVDIALNDVYPTLIQENELEVVASPDFDFMNAKMGEEGLQIEGEVAIMPEFEVANYDEIRATVTKEEVKVEKEEVEKELTNILKAKSTFELKEDGKVENGDTIIFDFEGSVDGEVFEGGTAENYELVIGSNSFIPGFEEQLIGVSSDETKDVKVTFPEEYHAENLKGKDAVFKCTVHEIKSQVLPEINDELLKELEGYDVSTKEELEKEIEKNIEANKKEMSDKKYREEIFTKVIEASNVTVPQAMINQETDNTLKNFKNQIKQQGIEFELYVQMMGTTEEKLREDIDKDSKRKIEEFLIVSNVAKAGKFEVTDADVDAKVKELSEMYSIEADKLLPMVGGKDKLSQDIEFDKAYKAIIGE